MAHLPDIIYDLALILLVGAFVTILFKRIKQPLVLGYIIAGFLVGPHFSFMPSIVDEKSVDTIAEIGVIMLLFSLGLEFSFKKLMSVGGSASVTAGVEIIFICLVGYLAGYLLGWNQMDSLFLGGMLASSSTTIILRAFDELGLKNKKFAKIVFGVLVVEDIIVILLMVLLSTVAVTQQFEGGEIVFTILKLAFFLVLWFLLGIYLLPLFIKKTKKWLDDEIILIFSMGLCFGMVILATKVGFSAELGAFVMGSLIAETTLSERVEHLTQSLKQYFGTVFFVSVGMMINPGAMVEYAIPIIVITLITIIGKFLFSGLGALISGRSLKESIEIGSSMAQIGEFAFIVATLGLSLGVISEFLFPIAVGVSAITTFTTPYLIKAADPLYAFLEKHLPKKWLDAINSYSSGTEKIASDSHWKRYLNGYIRILMINSVVLIAITLLMKYFFRPYISHIISNENWQSLITLGVGTLISSPFLWAIISKQPSLEGIKENTWKDVIHNPIGLIAMNIGRIIVAILVMGFSIDQIVSTKVAIWAAPPIILVFLLIFNTRFGKIYKNIEQQFITNLNTREQLDYEKNKTNIELNSKNTEIIGKMEAWGTYITDFEVDPNLDFAGAKIEELRWKEEYGVNIVYIKREDNILYLPNRNKRILPNDKIGIIGTDEQIKRIERIFETSKHPLYESENIELNNINVRQLKINQESPFTNKSIRESDIRHKLQGLVVGIERDGFRLLNPTSNEIIKNGDILWIVGDTKLIDKFSIKTV